MAGQETEGHSTTKVVAEGESNRKHENDAVETKCLQLDSPKLSQSVIDLKSSLYKQKNITIDKC
jgi:hypothetical protein